MMKLPEVSVSYECLVRMFIAPIQSKLLLTGIELKVFNQLSEPKSADAVAKAIGTHPGNTRVFLDGLAATDLLQKKNGMYRNSPVAQAFLVEGSPTYLGAMLQMMHSDHSLENLSELVKEGPPPKPETIPEFTEEMSKKYAAIWANSERAGDAQTALEIVSKLPEFPSFRKMLDLGGGPGLIGMAIVASHPSMKGVIFDLPPVVDVAKAFIKEYGMEDRMEVLGGDFNRDPIGEGYDLVLACSCLEAAKDIDSIVKKVYDALNTGGVFASIFNSGLTQERTKPEPIVLSSLSIALMSPERSNLLGFDQGSVADSMLRVGFKSVHSRTLNTPWGSTELNIARK